MGKAKATKRLAIGAAVAAVGGYLAGILTAPKSGQETRQDIKEGVGKSFAEAEKELKKLHAELGDMVASTKAAGEKLQGAAGQELNDLLDKAKASKEKLRVMLSAMHEGDANDKDLHQAIKEANAAIEHLKDYLKK